MVVRKVWSIPTTAVGLGAAAITTGYVVGVAKGHFPAVLPFISDAGSLPPENCIFSQLLNMSAFFLILTFYMRHRQAVEFYGHRLNWEDNKWRTCSLVFMWIGICSAYGVTVVANFPQSENPLVHGIGAFFTFLSGILYLWGQVFISYAMIPRMASTLVNHIRLFLAFVATAALILHQVALIAHPFVPNGAGTPPEGWYGIHWWKPGDPFYVNHMVATCAEWLMVLAQQLFILSFAAELRFAYVHAPRVIFRKTRTEHDRRLRIVNVPVPAGPARQIAGDW